ncbi:type VI secretion system protein VasG [Microbulbifer thermotolerans]|uniref:type VI secretion system ATPase TssH n=1 Tax=Microbulbifer thermotolerans TaxID=252514 RepID=UPI0008E132B2|nr:type VI secretion system ATPase TssH [Microbulbifer thermotolerans]MCX2835732.1 type VI secretion system ATPase TssH [Microbulbifer thermotolerans]SFC35677.1 type VI secretion system protein VasG [Microbulbifer thermotolerans]
MINIDLKRLVDTMTPHMRDSLEGAAGLCLAQSQYNVELEHWLLKLLDQSDTDLYHLLEKHDCNPSHLAKQLATAIAGFKSGSSRPAALSPTVVEAAKNAWMLASIDCGHRAISSGHLLAALLLDETSRRQLLESCPELKNIAPESIRETARAMFGQSGESHHLSGISSSEEGAAAVAAAASKAPALDKYTINLTERAEKGEIDPVLGRDEEIRQCIDILTRRRQNNPILTGEAGVGKTAVVEGFALRIASGDVPDPLKGVAVRTLDLGLLQAGASVKGEFENRLKSVIEEVRASATPIILFIDEAHTMIGAGGKEGQGDAANLLKPALARGELRTIAATTWAEYKKYFERDPALTRRFQVVKVEEPSEDKAIDMMRGIATTLEAHHKVRILDEAIVASVKLSHRYIPGRQLPDKSVSLLDTACARVALGQSATPGAIEDTKRTIARAEHTIEKLKRENAATGAHQEQLDSLAQERAEAEERLTALESQLAQEAELIQQIKALRDEIDLCFQNQTEEEPADEAKLADLKEQLQSLHSQLREIQGETPLMQPAVDEQAIAEVVANWTGIPVGKMVSDEIATIQTLAERLNKRVIGQPHAIEAVAQAIRTSRAGLTDPRKPVGVFLFCGTSGVGKTETALALADELFGGEQSITTINMAEFKEEHKVSMLLGSPPGYVGYGEGGVLTEAARRKPYSVILLDEMEKAHPGVQDIFYNLFDKGTIKDGEGRDIDFKNTVIIMTSNAGEDAIRAIFSQVEEKPEPDVLLDNIRPYLLQKFKPAFLGRANVIAYYPLDDENLIEICKINMRRIEKRVKEHYGAEFSYDEDVLVNIVARCQESDTGARNIEVILNRTLLPSLASECLDKMAKGEEITTIHVGATEEGDFSYQIN